MSETDASNRIVTFKNVVVNYDKTTGYLYIDDKETDEQLAVFRSTIEPDELEPMRYEIAYLRGKITVYEKFLKDKGFIKEEEDGQTQIQTVS